MKILGSAMRCSLSNNSSGRVSSIRRGKWLGWVKWHWRETEGRPIGALLIGFSTANLELLSLHISGETYRHISMTVAASNVCHGKVVTSNSAASLSTKTIH